MNHVAHFPAVPIEEKRVAPTRKTRHSMITPALFLLAFATAGATDVTNTLATGQSILSETGWPMEAQLGLSAVFLAGFCYAAKLLLEAHRERVAEWRQRYEDERKEKNELVKRLREIQDAKDLRIRELENHDK